MRQRVRAVRTTHWSEGGRGAGAMNRKSVTIWSRDGSNRGLYGIETCLHVGY